MLRNLTLVLVLLLSTVGGAAALAAPAVATDTPTPEPGEWTDDWIVSNDTEEMVATVTFANDSAEATVTYTLEEDGQEIESNTETLEGDDGDTAEAVFEPDLDLAANESIEDGDVVAFLDVDGDSGDVESVEFEHVESGGFALPGADDVGVAEIALILALIAIGYIWMSNGNGNGNGNGRNGGRGGY